MKYPNRVEGFVSLPIIFLGSLILLLVGASLSTVLVKKSKQFNPPVVENRTNSFRLVSEEKSGDNLVLRFENTSRAIVTAYTLSLGQQTIGADFFPNAAQRGVAPGTIEEVRIPLVNVSLASRQAVIVLTVVFDDHTAEGDFQAAGLIFDRRRGYATQMKRIRSLLLKAAQSEDESYAEPSTLLRQLKDTISSLSEQDGDKPSPGLRSGLNFAKQWTLKLIERLESGEMDLELQQSGRIIERTTAAPTNRTKTGLEYIVEKVDEITVKL